MSLTPEEQAAIGRLRLAEVKWVAAYREGMCPSELKDEPWIQDLQHVAKIVLREHPADDDDKIFDALRQPSRDVAFPGQVGCGDDFCGELEHLADMCESLGVSGMNVYPDVHGMTHDPDLWAACLRAKVRQIRDAMGIETTAKKA